MIQAKLNLLAVSQNTELLKIFLSITIQAVIGCQFHVYRNSNKIVKTKSYVLLNINYYYQLLSLQDLYMSPSKAKQIE